MLLCLLYSFKELYLPKLLHDSSSSIQIYSCFSNYTLSYQFMATNINPMMFKIKPNIILISRPYYFVNIGEKYIFPP